MLLAVLWCCAPVVGEPNESGGVRLEHAVRADELMVYSMQMEWGGDGADDETVRQRARWSGLLVSSGPGGGIECVQMLSIDGPVRAESGRGLIVPLRSGVQLSVQPWSRQAVGWMLPDTDEASSRALEGLWAWVVWPSKAIRVGERWVATASPEANSIEWDYLLEDDSSAGGRSVARVTFETRGGEVGEPRARGRIDWDVEAGRLISAEARAEWKANGRARTVRLVVRLERSEGVGPHRRRALYQQFVSAIEIARLYGDGELVRAEEKAKEFVRSTPKSEWVALARSVVARADERRNVPEQLDEDALFATLSRLVVRWQEIASVQMDATEVIPPELRRLAGSFRVLVEANREAVMAQAGLRGGESRHRATATFALGFDSERGALTALYGLAEEADVTVRAWATYALAVRGDPQTDARLLVGLLSDEDSLVRARACQAVRACLAERAAVHDRVRRLLFERLDDNSVQVRYQAALGMEAFANEKDAARLRLSAESEVAVPVRERLEGLVQRLESVGVEGG